MKNIYFYIYATFLAADLSLASCTKYFIWVLAVGAVEAVGAKG